MNVRTFWTAAGILILAVTTAFAAQGQGWQGSGGWGMKGPYGKLYNPSTVETVTGKVMTVNQMTPMKGMGAGIHLDLKTEKETARA